MTPTTTHTTPAQPAGRKARRRPPRAALALIACAGPAAAERESAAELLADLAVLAEAGLIAPVEQHGAVRYAAIDPDGPAA